MKTNITGWRKFIWYIVVDHLFLQITAVMLVYGSSVLEPLHKDNEK